MYAPFPHPRVHSYEGHAPLQHLPSNISRELTDLSSIDLATEEDEEQPCNSKYGYPVSEPDEDSKRPWLGFVGGLFAIAALCGCIVAVGNFKVHLPSPTSASAELPSIGGPLLRWRGVGAVATGGLSARQLLESDELTELAASRVQAADPQLVDLEGPHSVRERVAAGFRRSAASAAPQLSSLQLSAEQKGAVLQVLRDMSDNARLHSTGLFVARALQEGRSKAADKEGVARFVLERLQPRLPEMRRLRDEVIPASMRPSRQRGVLTLDSEKMRFVETLGNRWNFELDASMPRVAARRQLASPVPRRRLASLGINANASHFIRIMREQAQDAKNALATANADLTSAVKGLDVALQHKAADSADQQQLAKSMACDAITEATNSLGTVDSSLSTMMAHLAKAKTTVDGSVNRGRARETVAKKVFQKLQADVVKVKDHIQRDQDQFQQTLGDMRSLVSTLDDSSLAETRSSLMYVQGEVQTVQAELIQALKDFGALYHIVEGDGKLIDTVKLYASSVFYQLQDQFGVTLPDVSNASVKLQECLDDPAGMVTELECRLTYAKMCLEILLGMKVDLLEVDLSTTAGPLPVLPSVATTAAPSSPGHARLTAQDDTAPAQNASRSAEASPPTGWTT